MTQADKTCRECPHSTARKREDYKHEARTGSDRLICKDYRFSSYQFRLATKYATLQNAVNTFLLPFRTYSV